ncbi:MAG: STAS domain-containing protein [Candidatus Binatus sp.]
MTQAEMSNRPPLTFEREVGEAPGTVVFHFSGPFTARTVFECQPPDDVSKMFDLQLMLPTGEPPTVNIFDLTNVPYMDSTGLGMVVRHYVRCQDKGVRFIATGVSPRVLELFKLTNVDTVIPMTATVEEAVS